jgi:hypothetical protein
MNEEELSKLKFPIGEFEKPELITGAIVSGWITVIERFPLELKRITEILTSNELNWKYRPDGWSIKQVVHHCADSHMNSLIRFKLALTEDEPKIRPYFEDRWAELSDYSEEDLTDSLNLISGVHNNWVKLLKSLSTEQLSRGFVHPEHNERVELNENIGIYAWHCNHHLEHIKMALQVKGEYN